MKFLIFLSFFFVTTTSALTETKLLLIGGGKRPLEAMRKFVSLAGGDKGRILIIPWASSSLEGAHAIKNELEGIGVDIAPLKPSKLEAHELTLALHRFTGIFFTGGDQNDLMDVINGNHLNNHFKQRFIQGVVFGGTSAGTAIMSDPMLSGESDLTVINASQTQLVNGLGLLPKGVIIDQHFIVRQRFNRLAGLILNLGGLGIGVDEGTSLLVTGSEAQVIGSSQVLIMEKSKAGQLKVSVLDPGKVINLSIPIPKASY